MRTINQLIIHCAASPNGRSLYEYSLGDPRYATPVMVIDRWHRERGFARTPYWRQLQNPGLSSIGYHFVIATNGASFTGRHLQEVGAHAAEYNPNSIGICMVGTDAFTPEQWRTLSKTIDALKQLYKNLSIVGHRDLPGVAKLCPGFDVTTWLAQAMTPLDKHVLNPAVQRRID